MEELLQEIDKYLVAKKDSDLDNPMTFVATIGIKRMTELVQKANETNTIIDFSYKGRKLEWKFIKNGR